MFRRCSIRWQHCCSLCKSQAFYFYVEFYYYITVFDLYIAFWVWLAHHDIVNFSSICLVLNYLLLILHRTFFCWFILNRTTHRLYFISIWIVYDIEGFRPEWYISIWDIPFWPGTLNMWKCIFVKMKFLSGWKEERLLNKMQKNWIHLPSLVTKWHSAEVVL